MNFLLLAALFTSAFAADSPSFTGNWAVHSDIAGNGTDQHCSFAVKGVELTGTCKSDRGSRTVTGTVKGQDVTWQYKTDYNGDELTLVYTGKYDGTTAKGSVDVQPMGISGEFTASAEK